VSAVIVIELFESEFVSSRFLFVQSRTALSESMWVDPKPGYLGTERNFRLVVRNKFICHIPQSSISYTNQYPRQLLYCTFHCTVLLCMNTANKQPVVCLSWPKNLRSATKDIQLVVCLLWSCTRVLYSGRCSIKAALDTV